MLHVSEGRERALVFPLINEMDQGRQGSPQPGHDMKARKDLVQSPLSELFSGAGLLWASQVLAISHTNIGRGKAEVQD